MIEDKLRDIIGRCVGVPPDSIHGETTFGEDLELDSLDFIDLILEVEEEFHTKIPEAEMIDLRTVNDLCGWLASHGC